MELFIPVLVREEQIFTCEIRDNCSSTIHTHSLEATVRRDIGRLFDAISWSPSLTKGVISASFHAAGNVEVRREQLIISVSGLKVKVFHPITDSR